MKKLIGKETINCCILKVQIRTPILVLVIDLIIFES